MADGSPDETLPPPGQDGTPVPGGISVLRLGPKPDAKNLNDPGHALLKGGKAWPGLFAFSSKEKSQSGPRLSVWHRGYTSVAQAWVLVGGNVNNRISLTLSVDRVRGIFAPARPDGAPETPRLQVVWERAFRPAPDGSGHTVQDDRPGSQGHCGIDHLYCGTAAQKGKLREQLADAVQPGDLIVMSDEQIESFRQSVPEVA